MNRGRIGGIVVAALVAAGLVVSIAAARRAHDPAFLRVNASIGGVAVHMTRAQVEARYGPPATAIPVTLPGGAGTLVRYAVHRGLLLITYDANGRVAAVETNSAHYRTARGVGPGTRAAGVRRLAGFRVEYCTLGYWNGTATTDANDIVTLFQLAGDRVDSVEIMQAALLPRCSGSGELPPDVGDGGFLVTAAIAGPPASGWVRSTPPGIACPTDCSELFPVGTVVTLQRGPSAGFLWEGWAADCEYLDPCIVRVDGPRHVVAQFREIPPPPPPPPSEDPPEGGDGGGDAGGSGGGE